jgi:hypothetical protein
MLFRDARGSGDPSPSPAFFRCAELTRVKRRTSVCPYSKPNVAEHWEPNVVNWLWRRKVRLKKVRDQLGI